MARENHTRFALLGLLSHEDLSGYDIKKHVKNGLNNFWDIGYGQIYPELKKLESAGLVCFRPEISDNGSVKKKYSITDKGREELKIWLKSPVSGESFRFEILLKLYFSAQIPGSYSRDKLTQFIRRHEDKLSLYSEYEDSLKDILDNKDHVYRYLTLRLGIHMEKAFLDWAKEADDYLQNVNNDEHGV